LHQGQPVTKTTGEFDVSSEEPFRNANKSANEKNQAGRLKAYQITAQLELGNSTGVA